MDILLNLKIILANIMTVITFISSFIFPVQMPEYCMIGHRGYSGKYPENTSLSFQKAAENGSGGAETDVRMTKDGVFVTSHDDVAIFNDGTELVISENDYKTLTQKPLLNEKTNDIVFLCTFKRYLEIMRDNDMVCFIELKGSYTDQMIHDVFTLADETYTLSQCILQSFDFDNLIKAHEQFPELRAMLTYGTNDTGYERCFEYGFSIDANLNNMTKEVVEEFHERGLEVAVYTANDIFALNYCKSLGVDYIESDYFGSAYLLKK